MKFDTSIVQTRVPSPLGPIAIAATAKGLAGLWFTDNQRYLPNELTGPAAWPEDADHPILKQACQQLGIKLAAQFTPLLPEEVEAMKLKGLAATPLFRHGKGA